MIRDILSVIGSVLWLILRFILIIALSMIGIYCLGTVFFFRFIWDGLIRLAVSACCVPAVILLIRIGRDKDEGLPSEDDFRP